MKKKIARALRRLAGKLDRYQAPDPVVEQTAAIHRQTKALENVADVLKGTSRPSVQDAVTDIAILILGPQIVRAVNESAREGVSDEEILSTLVTRLSDGWF